MNLPPVLFTQSSLPDVLASVALGSILLLAWLVTGRALKARENLPHDVARQWTVNVRNALMLIGTLGLLMIWAPQLRTFALSLTAVAVAIVVATKELIMCLSGAAFRTFTRAYAIGDIVQIGDQRGEVVDINLMATRLRETERREGSIRSMQRTIIVPHSLLFSQPARILARKGSPQEHIFDLVFETDVDLFAQHGRLTEIVSAALAAPGGEERPISASEPRVFFRTTDLGRLRLEIGVETTPQDAHRIENEITTAVGTYVYSQKAAANSDLSSS
ncbi:MAG: mechanosensitive ion channel domain-containing protein [Erythrobacter sp.]|nr:mechanosensitive ion channel domain-containing protein [Erythrobacter sp.]